MTSAFHSCLIAVATKQAVALLSFYTCAVSVLKQKVRTEITGSFTQKAPLLYMSDNAIL